METATKRMRRAMRWMLMLGVMVSLVMPVWGQERADTTQAAAADSSAAAAGSGAVPDSVQDDEGEMPSWQEDAWTEITTRRGARLTYIFYRRADTQNSGVVIRVENRNDVPIVYDFTVIFRAPGHEATAEARGVVPPGAMRTGDAAGLFWIPFSDPDVAIEEVGIRNLRIFHVPPDRLEEVKEKFGLGDEG